MSTHQSVYAELRPLCSKVMQKAGEYLNIQLNGIVDPIKLCSPDGKYKSMPLRFRDYALVELFKPFILEYKIESNKYYKCSVDDWLGFMGFINKHAKFTGEKDKPAKITDSSVKTEIPKSIKNQSTTNNISKKKKSCSSKVPINILSIFLNIIKCRKCSEEQIPHILCDDGFNLPQPGYIGKNYANKRLLLIAQNPGDCKPENKHYSNAQKYAKILGKLQKKPSKEIFNQLNEFLSEFIPKWSVFKKFPAAATELTIHDLAYINLIHCRTKHDHYIPKKACKNCVENHFLSTISLLDPALVISLGKHPHGYITETLTQRKIPHTFINRKQDLSSEERQKNRQEVIELVNTEIG